MPFMRKYNTLLVTGTTSIRIPIIKRAVVDFALSADWTPAAGDVKVFVDAAAVANITNLPTAIASGNGAFWEFILTAAELTCKQLLVVVSDAATKAVEDQSFIVETYGNASAMYAADLSLANLPANVTQLLGTAWLTPGTAGTPDVNAKQLGAAPVTATTSVTFTAASTVASTTNITAGTITTATNVTTVNGLAANVITAASIATGAIDADALASDAATEIRSLASGTSDSGTTTTMVDAARTEADTDYWRGQVIVFTSGTLLGQARLITAFTPGTDTITFSPATTVAAGTHTYEIWPGSDAILAQLTHTSAVIPTVSAVTGLTAANLDTTVSSRMATYTQPTGFLAATFPAGTVANTTNITAGTVTTATNVTTVNGLAANVITAASIATGAIDADALAADATTEINAVASGTADSGTTTTMVDAARTEADADYWKDMMILFTSGTIAGQARLITAFTPGTDTVTFSPATTQAVGTNTYEIIRNVAAAGAAAPSAEDVATAVWNRDATSNQTQGTFGQAIGDPVADTNTIFKAVVTDATGATVGVDVVAVKVDTAAILSDTGTDGVVVNAASLAADAATEIANAVWDTDCTGRQTQGTFGQAIGDPVADTNTIFKAVVTDATGATVGVDVVAVKAQTAAIEVDTAEIGAAGAGLTAINLPNQTMDIVGNITGNLSGSVGSVTGAVGSVTGLTAANLDTTISSRATPAQVKTQMTDALNVDTYAEPGQGTPAATTTLVGKIGYLFKNWRNRQTQTATTWSLFNDDAVTVDQKATVADDAVTASKTEIATGP